MDLSLAQSILDAAGITMPTGNPADGCYDGQYNPMSLHYNYYHINIIAKTRTRQRIHRPNLLSSQSDKPPSYSSCEQWYTYGFHITGIL